MYEALIPSWVLIGTLMVALWFQGRANKEQIQTITEHALECISGSREEVSSANQATRESFALMKAKHLGELGQFGLMQKMAQDTAPHGEVDMADDGGQDATLGDEPLNDFTGQFNED